ncbi:MAG TPA: AraC family transcriptional regulator [Polyangiaceae bacterium]|nr:AraC family transcriptional regulator [Polyangiaceae bacterium]
MSELAQIAGRHAPRDGMLPTAVPELHVVRATQRSQPVHAVQRPSLCFLVQGAKEVSVAGTTYRYTAGEHLVSTVDLPITGEIVEASPRNPYYCLVISLEPALVQRVLDDGKFEVPDGPGPGIFVGRPEPRLADAALRLARCLEDERDGRVLAPSILREIVYRLLCGPYGGTVRDLGTSGSRTQRIARAIERLKNSFAEPLKMAELAALAGMSPSSFHEHFKRITTLSPLQYQKVLRLQEARRLLEQGFGAADVAFRVGYQSPSQFSREYARCFGASPRSDARPRGASEPRRGARVLR